MKLLNGTTVYGSATINSNLTVGGSASSFGITASGTQTGSTNNLVGTGQNLLLYSEQFQQTGSWAVTNITVTADTVVGPTGVTSGDTITIGTSGTNVIRQTITLKGNTKYVFSFYALKGTATVLTATVYDTTAGLTLSTLDYSSIVSATAWTRISIPFTTSSNTSPSVQLNLLANTASTGTVYFWGAQLEISTASTAGTYIITTTAGVFNSPAVTFSGSTNTIGTDQYGNLFLTPGPTSALTAQKPDNTTTGGNNRGQYAVDWQLSRGTATQVASGNYAVIAGGYNNTNSGAYCVIGGGASNSLSGTYTCIGGGSYGTDRGLNGVYVFPSSVSPIANSLGVSQASLVIIARQTTDATATVLASNSSAPGLTNQVILPNNSAYYFFGTVVAGVTGAGDSKGWRIEGVIKRGVGVGTTALVGTPTITSSYADTGASTWTIAVTADTTNGGLAITFTGQAGTTIRCVAKIETTEMTF
jgi:hypothetical protein